MHMAIGSKSNVKLVDVGQNNTIQDFLLVPCCNTVLSHCVQYFPLHLKALGSNVTEVAYWIGERGVFFSSPNFHEFMSLMNSGGVFLK